MLGPYDRDEHEDAPQAVHDAGDGGQQIDEKGQRLPEPARRQLGDEQRDAKSQRRRDDQRDDRSDDRSIDGRRGAKMLADRIPLAARDERKAEPVERRPSGEKYLHAEQ
jgi:hypothetical protein